MADVGIVKKWVQEIFIGRVYSDTYEDPEDGGPTCAGQMENSYRLPILLISVISNQLVFHYIIISKFTGKYIKCSLQEKVLHPSILEKTFGVVQIFVFILQIFYKAISHRLIFILSPCHITTLTQGYLLLYPSTNKAKYIYLANIA